MKINYILNSDKVIVGYTEIPFDEKKPYVEVDKVYVGYSDMVDGIFHLNEDKYMSGKIKELYDVPRYKTELQMIDQWFKDNDWIPNKIITGEWSTDDPRWIKYLADRTVRRNRRDELINE